MAEVTQLKRYDAPRINWGKWFLIGAGVLVSAFILIVPMVYIFVQAFSNAQVKLLWSRRIGDAPGTPSRWLHRLLMILETARLKRVHSPWPLLARRLAEPDAVTPVAMPKPRPPVALRPKNSDEHLSHQRQPGCPAWRERVCPTT